METSPDAVLPTVDFGWGNIFETMFHISWSCVDIDCIAQHTNNPPMFEPQAVASNYDPPTLDFATNAMET